MITIFGCDLFVSMIFYSVILQIYLRIYTLFEKKNWCNASASFSFQISYCEKIDIDFCLIIWLFSISFFGRIGSQIIDNDVAHLDQMTAGRLKI